MIISVSPGYPCKYHRNHANGGPSKDVAERVDIDFRESASPPCAVEVVHPAQAQGANDGKNDRDSPRYDQER